MFGNGVLEVLYLPRGVRILMDRTDDKFNSLACKLDSLVNVLRTEFSELGIDVIDQSNRAGYRGELPCWSYRFETRVRHEPEVFKVTFTLTIQCDDCSTCTTWLRSEVFQLGQLSRWQKTVEAKIQVHELFEQGVLPVVLRNIDGGNHAYTS